MDENINKSSSRPKEPKGGFSCFMKIIGCFALVIIVLLGLAAYLYFGIYLASCKIPIKFSVGDVDSRFKITSDEVAATAKDAADRWNQKSDRNLYQYDPEASLKINLIYDDRQAKVDQLNAEVSKINSSSTSIESFRNQLDADITQYQSDLSTYNQQVASWNSQGGAPPVEYQKLENQRIELQNRQSKINQKASLLNLQIDEHNSNLDDVKSQIDAEKNTIVTQGEYKGDRIDVYTFGNADELRLVLMHELGHALTSDHAKDSKSIMYYMLGDQDLKNPIPSDEDITLVESKCKL